MEQFLKTKDQLINLAMVDKILISYKDEIATIELIRSRSGLSTIELFYEKEVYLRHDMSIILAALKNGKTLIELEYG